MKMASPYLWSAFLRLIAMTFAIIFPVFSSFWWSPLPATKALPLQQRCLIGSGFPNFTNMWTLSTFRSAFPHQFLGWTFIWALAASTVFKSYSALTTLFCRQPFVGKRIFDLSSCFMGCSSLHHDPAPSGIYVFNDSVRNQRPSYPIIHKDLPILRWGLWFLEDRIWINQALIRVGSFPYLCVLTPGSTPFIPNDLFTESCFCLDGANGWQKFRNITQWSRGCSATLIGQPHFNFNNFSMFCFQRRGPGSVGRNAESTENILISWIYKLTTSELNASIFNGCCSLPWLSLWL